MGTLTHMKVLTPIAALQGTYYSHRFGMQGSLQK